MRRPALLVSMFAAIAAAAVLAPAHGSDALSVAKPKPLCLGKRATIVGNARANVLTGTRRNDVIVGLGGNDTIDGRGGNDLVCGAAGNDKLLGGAGADRIDGGAGRDTCRGGENVVRCEETRTAVPTGALPAGEYVTDVFTPRFGFVVGSGWSAPFGEDPRQIIFSQRRDPGGLSVTFDSFARGQSVAQTIARFAGIQGVQASTPAATTIGSATGQRVDLLVTADGIVLVPGLAERYELEPNDRVRAYAVGVGGATVTVLVEAPAAEFDAFLGEAQKLLESIRWG